MVSSHYKNVDGIMIVFDYSNIKSFYDISKWMKEINMFTYDEEEDEDIVIYLIGNKVDIKNEGVNIDDKEIKRFVNGKGIKLYNVSASKNIGVYQVFRKMVEDILKKRERKRKISMCMINAENGKERNIIERESLYKEEDNKGMIMDIESFNNNYNSKNDNNMCVIN